MKQAPILLVLDLWSLGHSATDIVKRLGFNHRRQVERIIEQARSIGDPRAVYHTTGTFIRGTGIPKRFRRKKPRQTHYNGFQLVPLIGKTICAHGHMRTPWTVNAQGQCMQCLRVRRQGRAR